MNQESTKWKKRQQRSRTATVYKVIFIILGILTQPIYYQQEHCIQGQPRRKFLLSYGNICDFYLYGCDAWQSSQSHRRSMYQQQRDRHITSNISSSFKSSSLSPVPLQSLSLSSIIQPPDSNTVTAIRFDPFVQNQQEYKTSSFSSDEESWYRAYQQVIPLLSDVIKMSQTNDNSVATIAVNENTEHDGSSLQKSTYVMVQIVLEKFVQRIFQKYSSASDEKRPTISSPFIHDVLNNTFGPIEAVEEIINRLSSSESTYCPTHSTFESIFYIYQMDMKSSSYRQDQQHQYQNLLFQKYCMRTMQLLQYWLAQEKNIHETSISFNQNIIHKQQKQQQPQKSIMVFMQHFFYSVAEYQSRGANSSDGVRNIMSTDLWEFYLRSINMIRGPKCNDDALIRVHKTMLQILQHAGKDWDFYQFTILHSIIRNTKLHEIPKMIELYGGYDTILRALTASAKAGRVAETSYLSRFLLSTLQQKDHLSTIHSMVDDNISNEHKETLHKKILMIHIESLYNSNDTGSLLFIERTLWPDVTSASRARPQTALNSTTCKLLLHKYVRSSIFSSLYPYKSLGRRAESFLYWSYKNLYDDDDPWYPDVECANCIVDTYLQSSSTTKSQVPVIYLKQIQMADHFIRHFVRQFGLRKACASDPVLESMLQSSSSDTVATLADFTSRIFEKLFDCYAEVLLILADKVSKSNWTENCSIDVEMMIKVVQQVDTLFRFFMIQHRDGKVDTESPQLSHVDQLRSMYRNCNITISSFVIQQCTSTSLHKESKRNLILATSTMQKYIANVDEYLYLLNNFSLRNKTNVICEKETFV